MTEEKTPLDYYREFANSTGKKWNEEYDILGLRSYFICIYNETENSKYHARFNLDGNLIKMWIN